MMVHSEIALGRAGMLDVRLEAGPDGPRYTLRFEGLVEYVNGRKRIRGGRWTPYEFRSVEQLRYDFERDVRAAGGRLGEAA